MNPDTRWKVLAALGAGALALGLYATWKTLLYFNASTDAAGVAIFGSVALGLFMVAGLHWFMAAGFKLGRLDLVTGSIASATLHQGSRAVITAAKVQFLRRLDTDNASLSADDRYVFFICAYRPWVCKEADFQVV